MKQASLFLAVAMIFLMIFTPFTGCGQKADTSTTSSTATTAHESTTTIPPTEPTNQSTSPTSTESAPETTTPSTTATTTTTTPPTTTTTTPATTTTPSFVPIVWTAPSNLITLTVDESTNRATYQSGGVQISAYFYKPAGFGPFPAILMLHGKDGLQEHQRSYASWLAKQGYVVLAPDYLTPVGIASQAWTISDCGKYTDRIREIQGDGLESLKSLTYVDSNRIGVVGFSLGGYYAFILATRDDVKGIVSYYGAYFFSAPYKPENDRLVRYKFIDIVTQIKTPVLMFHGDADALVPISTADAVHGLLDSSNKLNEYYVYSGVGHAFNIQGASTYNTQATADSQQRALVFLEAKLK